LPHQNSEAISQPASLPFGLVNPRVLVIDNYDGTCAWHGSATLETPQRLVVLRQANTHRPKSLDTRANRPTTRRRVERLAPVRAAGASQRSVEGSNAAMNSNMSAVSELAPLAPLVLANKARRIQLSLLHR
jgi:hypothetical protein